ncbi:hypothetical protein [Proteiniclasticum sp. QWL-01]|uniref:hypothetical protein n=1 Tax=Proteiniclasticum sp. QWL-01 TaxID=3036945 RepID=UPI002411972C|nr:hypothetical protein [Proteiniclasticum sp. QWL-01]WFF73924.1 hypothetical protein P6M73_05605 [Proteiniclasticum sp. QWL-01]
MKICFERRAYEGETRVLTSFAKTREFSDETTMEEVVDQYVYQYLSVLELPDHRQDWNLMAVRDMSCQVLARVRQGAVEELESGSMTVREYFGNGGPVMILGMTTATDPCPKETSGQPGQTNWKNIEMPIRIDTKDIQILALFLALISIVAFVILVLHYQRTKVLLAEPLITVLVGMVACYFTLLKGRRITFKHHVVVYRNRFNRYERFTPEQFDHVEWFQPGRDIKFVFRYEEKQRNFISTRLKHDLRLIIWAKSQGIPIYSSYP